MPVQGSPDDFVWRDLKRQQSAKWIRPIPISIIFNLMTDTSRWRGPHAQMHHYHSTLCNSSKLLTAPGFSLATVGQGRRGPFTPAHRQTAVEILITFLVQALWRWMTLCLMPVCNQPWLLLLCSLIFVRCIQGLLEAVWSRWGDSSFEELRARRSSLTKSNYCTWMQPLQSLWWCSWKSP